MKIKLAILENDSIYLNRITSALNIKYPDKLAVFAFTGQELALKAIRDQRIDVLVANAAFDIDVSALPKSCGFAYLADTADVETIKGSAAICKFQKIDLIYKQLLSIYSEKVDAITGVGVDDGSTRLFVFSSPCGGVGTSCVAAAAAIRFAASGKKTLYLNLERFGSSDSFFTGEGSMNMSDVIFALKSRRPNLQLKLESAVKQDGRGVYFFSGAKVALDMLELKGDEAMQLINTLKISGDYDVIVLDTDFRADPDGIKLMRQAAGIVWVSDGSETANYKVERAMEALDILDGKSDLPVTNRVMVMYNKFSNKTGSMLDEQRYRTLGGAHRYDHATLRQVVDQLTGLDALSKLVR